MYLLSEQEIEKKINGREAKIALIGLGRVGLPLAVTLADEGFEVLGIDIREETITKVSIGESPYPDEVGLKELLQRVAARKTLKATSQIAAVKEYDLIIIAVPTLIRDEEPEIDAIKIVVDELTEHLSPGMVIVLQSTVPPSTTQHSLGKTIAERTGLKPGKDIGLAYSPERTQASQVLRDLKTYPKIVAGIDRKSTFIVSMLYSTFAPSIIEMGSMVAAEIEKVIENTYRDVNIAFANELAQICEVYGIDVYEIIKAANSQPYCNILNPGLVGGHCIPMDPYYIIGETHKHGVTPKLMSTAREINESVFQRVIGMVEKGSKAITILGLSFKENVKSFETSHTLKLVDLLAEKGYDVTVHDPFLDDTQFQIKTDPDLYHAIEGADCVILSTAHSAYSQIDFRKVKQLMKGELIIDIRGMFHPQEVMRCGLKYKGIGRILP